MKSRQGYVSNSSSSSFIIATENNTNGKFVATLECDITNFSTQIETIKELDDYIISEYGWSKANTIETILDENGTWLGERYSKAKDAIDAGKVIFWGSASYNDTDDPFEMMIGNGGLRHLKDVEIIDED